MPRRRRAGDSTAIGRSGCPGRTEDLRNVPVPEQLFNEALAAFPHLDAQVVYMVLAEYGVQADVAMDSLLELNDEARLTMFAETKSALAQDTGNGISVPTPSLGAHCVREPIDVTDSPKQNHRNDYKMDIHQAGMGGSSTCGDTMDTFYPKNKQSQNSQAFSFPTGDVMPKQPQGDAHRLERLSYTTFIPGNVSHGQDMYSSHFTALNDRNLGTKYYQNGFNNWHPFLENVTQSDFYRNNRVGSFVTSDYKTCDAGCMDELIIEDPKGTVNNKCAATAKAPSLVLPNIIGAEKSEIECSGSTNAPQVLCKDGEQSKADITINPPVVAIETHNAKLNLYNATLSSSGDYFQASNTFTLEDPRGHTGMPHVSLMPTWRSWQSAPPSAIGDCSGIRPYTLKTPWQQAPWAGKFGQHTERQYGPKATWPTFIVPKVPVCAKESASLNWRLQQPSTVAKIPIVRGHKVLILLRGLPGSGKSTLARKMRTENKDAVVLSTDDYFVRGGIYSYNPDLLSESHEWNHKRAREAMDACMSPVIIDNTNLKLWEMKPYVAMARQRKYSITFTEPDTPWKLNPRQLERKNTHGISKERITRMMAHYEHQVDVDKILNSFQTKPMMNPSDPEHMNIQQTLNEPSQRHQNPFIMWPSHGDAAQPLMPRKNTFKTKDQLKYLQNLAKNVAVGECDGNRKTNHQGLKNSSGKRCFEFPSLKGNHGDVEHESKVESYEVKVPQSLEQPQNERKREDGHSNSGKPQEQQTEEQHLENVSEPPMLLGKDMDFPGEWPGSSPCRVLEQRSRRSRKCEKEETTVDAFLPDAGSINSTGKIANHDSTHSTVESNEKSSEVIVAPTAMSVVAEDLVQKHSSEKHAEAPVSFETDILESVHPEEVANVDGLDVPVLVQAELNCEKSKSFAIAHELSTVVEPAQNTSPLHTGKCLSAEAKLGQSIAQSNEDDGKRSAEDEHQLCKLTPLFFLPKIGNSNDEINVCESNIVSAEKDERETQTAPEDFALAWKVVRNMPIIGNKVKILTGSAERANAFCDSASASVINTGGTRIPYTMKLDKGTSTDDLHRPDPVADVKILKAHFQSVSSEVLMDIYEKCSQNLNWTVNLLIESGVELAEDSSSTDGLDSTTSAEHIVSEEAGVNISSLKLHAQSCNHPKPKYDAFTGSQSESDTVPDSAGPKDPKEEIEHLTVNDQHMVEKGSPSSAVENATSGVNSDPLEIRATDILNVTDAVCEDASRTCAKPYTSSSLSCEGTFSPAINETTGSIITMPLDNVQGTLSKEFASDGTSSGVNVLSEYLSISGRNGIEDLAKDERNSTRTAEGECSFPKSNFSSMELVFPAEFALQLIELFGPVGLDEFGLTPEDLSVSVDLDMAKTLHQLWKISVQNRNKEEALSYQLLRESTEFPPDLEDESSGKSSVWQEGWDGAAFQTSTGHLHQWLAAPATFQAGRERDTSWESMENIVRKNIARATHPTPVSLRDIMSEELASELNQAKVCRPWKDASAKLKEQKLFAMFPGMDRQFLRDIYRDNGYSLEQSERFLRSVLNVDEPSRTVIASEMIPAMEQMNLKIAIQRSLSPGKPQEGESAESKETTQELSSEDLRAEAFALHRQRHEYFRKAAEAFKRGQRDVATYYAQQGHELGERMKRKHLQAAHEVMQKRNAALLPQNIVDLHGLHVMEGTEALLQVLKKKQQEYQQNGRPCMLSVITGRGNNSYRGIARLRPAVFDLLRRQGYRFTEPQEGLFKVYVPSAPS
uniref:NEDD4-binding protein 2-like isoform X2 n=1 Tax=Myxine glutinosa TaxID=7769 RepID=UPI00358F0F25